MLSKGNFNHLSTIYFAGDMLVFGGVGVTTLFMSLNFVGNHGFVGFFLKVQFILWGG